MSSVFIEPMRIGGERGVTVYVLIRRVGQHMDIETMPDDITDSRVAHQYASNRWGVPECDVEWKPEVAVQIGEF